MVLVSFFLLSKITMSWLPMCRESDLQFLINPVPSCIHIVYFFLLYSIPDIKIYKPDAYPLHYPF